MIYNVILLKKTKFEIIRVLKTLIKYHRNELSKFTETLYTQVAIQYPIFKIIICSTFGIQKCLCKYRQPGAKDKKCKASSASQKQK